MYYRETKSRERGGEREGERRREGGREGEGERGGEREMEREANLPQFLKEAVQNLIGQFPHLKHGHSVVLQTLGSTVKTACKQHVQQHVNYMYTTCERLAHSQGRGCPSLGRL